VESSKGEIQMARHDKNTFCRMMEFIYTGTYFFLLCFAFTILGCFIIEEEAV
jgi:hypothetical protein